MINVNAKLRHKRWMTSVRYCIKLVIIPAVPAFEISLLSTHSANVATGLILAISSPLVDISAKSRDEGIGTMNGVLGAFSLRAI